MNAEDRLICALTRHDFQDEHRNLVLRLCRPDIRWDRVLVTARQHGVAPLVCWNLDRIPAGAPGIDDAVLMTFRLLREANRVAKRTQSEQIAELVSELKRRGIDVMLVKGAAMDLSVYDAPWYTVSADVDLILRRHRADLSPQERSDIWSLLASHPNLEWDLFQHHDVNINGVLTIDFE